MRRQTCRRQTANVRDASLIRNHGGGQPEASDASNKAGSRTAPKRSDKRSASETFNAYFVHVGETAGNHWKRCCGLVRWRSYRDGLVQWPTCCQRRWGMEDSEQDEREERIGGTGVHVRPDNNPFTGVRGRST